MKPVVTNDPILNIVERIDYLADEYRKKQTTQTLIDFLFFRTDANDMLARMWVHKIINPEKTYACTSYIGFVTKELNIFPNLPDCDEESKLKLIKWKEGLNR